MKTFLLVLSAVSTASVAVAGDAARDPIFQFRTGGIPTLELSRVAPDRQQPHGAGTSDPAVLSGPVPAGPMDLLAPASTRRAIIHESRHWSAHPVSTSPHVSSSKPVLVPASGTDLFGPASQRKKLIEDLRSRIDSAPAQPAPEPRR